MRRVTISGAAVLVILISLCICCVSGPVSAGEIIDQTPCCEDECAVASSVMPTAVLAPQKRVVERPVAIAADPANAFVSPESDPRMAVTAAAASSPLFEPLTTIQLRI